MNAKQFQLTSQWMIAAPIDLVWQQLSRPERWPEWWPAVLAVQTMSSGDANGIGAYRRMHWRTALPYRLSFNMGLCQRVYFGVRNISLPASLIDRYSRLH